MDKGLMAKEDLDELGFKHDVKFDHTEKVTKENKGFIGGLSVKPVDGKE